MCLINQERNERSTQTMNDKRIGIRNESQLIDDITGNLIEMKERTYFTCFSL